MMTLDISTLAPVFARYPVVAAYLFGSQATGNPTPLSDIDIGVILEPDVRSAGQLQALLISDLMAALHRSDIDVAILNAAPPLLKERAISRGRVIFCRDANARVRFEASARREYLETKRLRETQDRALLDRYTRQP